MSVVAVHHQADVTDRCSYPLDAIFLVATTPNPRVPAEILCKVRRKNLIGMRPKSIRRGSDAAIIDSGSDDAWRGLVAFDACIASQALDLRRLPHVPRLISPPRLTWILTLTLRHSTPTTPIVGTVPSR